MLLGRARRRRGARTAGFGLAVSAAAVASAIWLPGVSDSIRTGDDPGPAERPTETVPSPTPPALPPRLMYAPYPLQQPGEYSVSFSGSAASVPHAVADVRAVVNVPNGFTHDRDKLIPKPHDPDGPDDFVDFSTVGTVIKNSCRGKTFPFEDPGPTVADLATALVDQPRLRSTDPVPVSLDGHDGLYVELAMPANAPKCGHAGWFLWLTPGLGTESGSLFPGGVGRFWILDVEGDRLVIEVFQRTDSTEDEIAALTQIVESINFTTIERPEP